jgi:integrase
MNNLAKNIVKLDNTKVYDQIEKYLTKHSYNSADTERAYRRDIGMFFGIVKEKELKYLTIEDVQITLDDFEDFIQYLFEKEDAEGNKVYNNKTINRKVAAVKGVIKYLAAKKIDDEYIVKDVSYMPLVKSLPETSNSYGVLEVSEVLTMAELALQERGKGEIKRLLILFALDTCVRKTAILNLKWSNFIEREDGVLVQGIDKGNKDFRHLISKEFYNELLTIKNDKSDKVFDLSDRRITDMMDRLKTKMKIAPERNVCFHSIRKSGVTFRFRITGGDILEAKRAAGHSNIATTQIYLQSEDYGSIGAVSSKGKLDMELYKKVDNDVLLEAIAQCKKDFQLILNLKIQEIINRD